MNSALVQVWKAACRIANYKGLMGGTSIDKGYKYRAKSRETRLEEGGQ